MQCWPLKFKQPMQGSSAGKNTCSSSDLKQSKCPKTTDCLLQHMSYHYCSNSQLSAVHPLKFETVSSLLQWYKDFFCLKKELVMELVIGFGAHTKHFIFSPKSYSSALHCMVSIILCSLHPSVLSGWLRWNVWNGKMSVSWKILYLYYIPFKALYR